MKHPIRTSLLAALCCAVCLVLESAETAWPRAGLLLSPEALAPTAKDFVIVDAREKKAFEESRIPGAVWADAAAWTKAFGEGKDAAPWSVRIGALGIGRGMKVVVYDDSVKDAARIWWILRYWGVEDGRLLDGGWRGWKGAGQALETKAPGAPKAAVFEAKAQAGHLATKAKILGSLKEGSLQLVDARSEGEFSGKDKLSNRRGGSIPGAKHLDWTDLIDGKTLRFKGPGELKRLFQEAGISLERPTAAYCQSGGRASVMAFGLELMGSKDVANYHPSWAEWGNAEDTPVEAGKPRGKKAD